MGEERNSMQTFFTNKTPEGEILPGAFYICRNVNENVNELRSRRQKILYFGRNFYTVI